MKNYIRENKTSSFLLILTFICAGVVFGFRSSHEKLIYKDIHESISGEDVFKAIYFNDTKLHAYLPEELHDNTRRHYQPSITDNIIAKIKDSDPAFFETFKRKIESGNPIEVKFALKSGIASISKFHKIALANDKIDYGSEVLDSVIAYSAVIVDTTVVAQPTVIDSAASGTLLPFNGYIYFLTSLQINNLENEKFVAAVTKSFDIHK